MKLHSVSRRKVLALISAGSLLLSGCVGDGDDDSGSPGGEGNGNENMAADPVDVCEIPDTDDRTSLLPEGDEPVDRLVHNRSLQNPDFKAFISRPDEGTDETIKYNYGGFGHEYDAEVEKEFSAWAIEFDKEPPEPDADEIFQFIEPSFGPDYDVALYVLLGKWVLAAGGTDEEISRSLLAQFEGSSEDCAEAATVVTN